MDKPKKPLTKAQLNKITKDKFIEYIISKGLNNDEFFYDALDTRVLAERPKKDARKELMGIVINELKDFITSQGVMYSPEEEWKYITLILNAKEFGAAAERVNMNRVQFAKAIVVASKKINYWKGTCCGPKSIYFNYADVYNRYKQKEDEFKQEAQKKGKTIRF